MAAPSVFHPDFKPLPYWWEAWAPRRELPADLPAATDVAIIGGGYAGLNAALELARAEKTIGAPLTAHVSLSAPPETYDLLAQSAPDLPMVFIVSSVAIERGDPSAGVRPAVSHAPGDQCPRCWRFVTETVPDGDAASLCLRCADAVGDAVAATS